MAHDHAVEKWLKDNGFAYRFEKAAKLDRVDMAEADANPARLHRKLDHDVAYDYALDYEKGADFPALVVQEVVGRELWLLWGGRHRISGAASAMKTTHDMIVVIGETNPARIELACRVLNSLGVGKKDTIAEKLQHIAELRKRHTRALPLDELAAHFKVRRPTINQYLAVIASQERAERLNKEAIWSPRKVSQELMAEAGRIQSDEVFGALVDLVADHQTDMRGPSATDFVKKLRTMVGDQARLAAIIDRREELRANDLVKNTGNRRGPTNRTTRYTGHIRSLVRDYPGTADKLHLGDQGACAALKRLREEASRAKANLADVIAEYDRLIAEAEKVEAWRKRPKAA